MSQGMLAENVYIAGHNGDMVESYMARPLGEGPYPGVVLLHHMPGWDEGSKEMVRKFAYHDYVAICPNLHHREGPGNSEELMKKMMAVGGAPDDQCIGDVDAAIRYLEALPYYNGKVGVIGFCSGGRQTYLVSCNIERINAGVVCYGGRIVTDKDSLTPRHPVAPIDMTKDLHCPILGLFGKEDKFPSPEKVSMIEEELIRYNKTYEFHSYENAGHGFFSVESPMYRQHAAVDGWQKVFAWFDKYCRE